MRIATKVTERRRTGIRLRSALLFLFTFYSLPVTLYAAKIYHAAGSTSATFLKLGVGARAVGMSGAFTGVADDPYAIYWNPAGLASLEGEKNIGFFHNDHFQGLKQEFMLYSAPVEGLSFLRSRELRSGAFGLGLNYFYTPKDMERRSGLNENDPLAPISPVEGKFAAYDASFSVGYGWKPEKSLSLGAALKVIRQQIDTDSADSFAADLGVLKDFKWLGDDYTAGFSAQNIGPGVRFVRRYDLPLVFKAGLSRRLPDTGALIALGADKPIDNYPSFALGLEYPLIKMLYLRTGYRYRHTGNELGPWSGFSAGAGIAFGRVSFDYAFAPFGDLGNSHRFSLNARLGRSGGSSLKGYSGASDPGLALVNSRSIAFETVPKALAISMRGVKYGIKAASASSDLYALSFNTFVRGQAAAGMTAKEGELPQALLSRLPAGLRPLKSWQSFSAVGDVQGDMEFKFKATEADLGGSQVVFLYLAKNGWKEAPAEPLAGPAEEDGYRHFSAYAPFSTHYVIAARP